MSEYNKNDYRILGNNGKKMVFKIPVGNMTPAEAKKELEKLIADYLMVLMVRRKYFIHLNQTLLDHVFQNIIESGRMDLLFTLNFLMKDSSGTPQKFF